MALMACWKCKGQVSTTAPTCPHCGAFFSKGPPQAAAETSDDAKIGITVAVGGKTPLEDYDEYEACTKAADWSGICRLNNVPFDSFGTTKELMRLPEHLESGEVVFALTSGLMNQGVESNPSDWAINSWLVVLTSERFLFMDCALLTNSVDIQSVRHDRVQAVSSSQGWMFGKVMIDLGSRVITIDNCVKSTVAAVSSLAIKWQRALSERKAPQRSEPPPPSSAIGDPIERLERLAKLYESGALSKEEFYAAKSKLIGAL